MFWIEFVGSFTLALLTLTVAHRYYQEPRSPLFYGFVTAIIVFCVVTPLFYLSGSQRPILNPAAALISKVQGRITTSTLVAYIIAQLLGFFAGYAVFKLLS